MLILADCIPGDSGWTGDPTPASLQQPPKVGAGASVSNEKSTGTRSSSDSHKSDGHGAAASSSTSSSSSSPGAKASGPHAASTSAHQHETAGVVAALINAASTDEVGGDRNLTRMQKAQFYAQMAIKDIAKALRILLRMVLLELQRARAAALFVASKVAALASVLADKPQMQAMQARAQEYMGHLGQWMQTAEARMAVGIVAALVAMFAVAFRILSDPGDAARAAAEEGSKALAAQFVQLDTLTLMQEQGMLKRAWAYVADMALERLSWLFQVREGGVQVGVCVAASGG